MYCTNEFPSPCGDVVLKYYESEYRYEFPEDRFPSPCGDVVLKL